MERTTKEIRKEIRKYRHKGERPIYWIMFTINMLFLLFIVVFTVVMHNTDDFTGIAEDSDTIQFLQDMGAGLYFLVIAYVIIIILCALYQNYAMQLSYSVKVTPRNFPEIYEKSVEYARLLGMKKVPEVYIQQQNGVLNAFSAWVVGKRYIQLNAEIVDIAYMENKDFDVVYFVMAHEFGHHYFNHVTFQHNLSILFAKVIPLLDPLYTRSQEYSADRVAQSLIGEAGVKCMAMLSVGRHLYPYVDVEDYLENIYKKPNVPERLARWIVNLLTDHPIAPLRVRAIVDPEKKSGRLI